VARWWSVPTVARRLASHWIKSDSRSGGQRRARILTQEPAESLIARHRP
jgi:hypothetical protein